MPRLNSQESRNRRNPKCSNPVKPGLTIKKYFTVRGDDASEALGAVLGITTANARKLILGHNPFKECHFKKIRKMCPDFDIEAFMKANDEYEAWRASEKPREPKTETPLRVIVSLLRQLFLRSTERSRALTRSHHCCELCGVREKDGYRMEVHHKSGEINWNSIAEAIKKELLCSSDELIVMCHNCHKLQHKGEKK